MSKHSGALTGISSELFTAQALAGVTSQAIDLILQDGWRDQIVDLAATVADDSLAAQVARLLGRPVDSALVTELAAAVRLRSDIDCHLVNARYHFDLWGMGYDEARWEALDTLDAEIAEFLARLLGGVR